MRDENENRVALRNVDPLVEALPASIRPVAEHLGMGIVRRIIDAIPGARVHVPKSLSLKTAEEYEQSAFYLLAPEDQADLSREFGGDIIVVPMRLKSMKWRHARIRQLFEQGANINSIAFDVAMTRRAVLDFIQVIRVTKAHDAGMTNVKIAAELGCSVKKVREILGKLRRVPHPATLDAPQSKSDGYLTPHAGGVGHPPSQETENPAREPENAI